MSGIEETLEKWRFAHGYKRGWLGSLKFVKGWKWPTKAVLRQLTGMDADEFESALREAAAELMVEVKNGRVGLTSAPVDVATGEKNFGSF